MHGTLLPPAYAVEVMFFVLSVCMCLSVRTINFWTNWHRNFIFGMVVTSRPYLGQVWISRSLGQGHLMENANFATLDISLTQIDLPDVKVTNEFKVIPRSRSFQGQIISAWLSIGRREVGLRLKGILVITKCKDYKAAAYNTSHK